MNILETATYVYRYNSVLGLTSFTGSMQTKKRRVRMAGRLRKCLLSVTNRASLEST